MLIFKELCSKVEKYLNEEFKEHCKKIDTDFFVIKQGSARVHILVQEYNEKESLVSCRAYVVSGSEFSYKLFKKLLLMNSEDLMFGKFGIDRNGYIILSHTLLGSTMDKEEIIKTVKEISIIADDMDDILVKQYGGKTAIESFMEKTS